MNNFGLHLRPGAKNTSRFQLPSQYRGTNTGLASRGGLANIFERISNPKQWELGVVDDKKVTGAVDGNSGAAGWLKGLTGAVLDNIGALDDTPEQPQVTPVVFGGGSGGGGDSIIPMLAIGAVAVGVVYYATAK